MRSRVHNRQSYRLALLIAAMAVVAAGCSSGTSGKAEFDRPACSGDRAVKDDSFCFVLPADLDQSDVKPAEDGLLVELDENNAINVRRDSLGGDSSTLSNSELLDRFNRGLAGKGNDSHRVDTDSGRILYTAAGRAIGYNGTGQVSTGPLTFQQNVIFHKSSMLQVICLWTDKEKAIRSACVDILRSARFTDG